jgi:putative ABC transport system permease protein
MYKNNLKTSLRFLKSNKVFAGINALGLSIALAASFIILLYVINEFSYNRCHKNGKRIFRVLNYYENFNMTMSGTPYILASTLKEEFPQIESAVKIVPQGGLLLKINNEFIDVPKILATDSEIFNIFTIPLIMASTDLNLLEDKYSIVLCRDLAEKFFPGQDPVDKEIEGMMNNEAHTFTVKGVFENFPVNSSLQAQCFINSWWSLGRINQSFGTTDADVSWDKDFWSTWILLSKDGDVKSIDSRLKTFESKYMGEKSGKIYSLQNLPNVYLHSDSVANNWFKSGNLGNVRLFLTIALLIVLVAAINYILLSTAVSTTRAKEIGIRKTFGAGNKNIRNQMLSESILLSTLVFPLALILAWLSLPKAGKLFQTELQVISSNIMVYISVFLILSVLVGIASGVYTSAYLSRLNVLDVFKNSIRSGKGKTYFRSSLIVIQLVIFCTFVACTLMVRSQYQYALKKDLGYYNKDVLLIDLGREPQSYPSFLSSIKSSPDVIQAAGAMMGIPMQGSMSMLIPHFQDKEQKINVEGLAVDYNFLETMGIPVIKGRDFSEEYGGDLTQSCILNETAVKRLGITDPVGAKLEDKTIIGIVKDFNLHSIHSDIPPLKIDLTDKFISQIAVHYKPGTLNNILPILEADWKKASSESPFIYYAVEDVIRNLYSSEKNLSTIVSIFALFTVVIAVFGLFGLTLFIARTRTKEIGIKKVFGSSEQSILISFLLENVVLVVVSTLISIPVTIYFMTKWLNNFAYKVNFSWWVFAIAFVVAVTVVLLTVFFHSYKVSRTNPVAALRYE